MGSNRAQNKRRDLICARHPDVVHRTKSNLQELWTMDSPKIIVLKKATIENRTSGTNVITACFLSMQASLLVMSKSPLLHYCELTDR